MNAATNPLESAAPELLAALERLVALHNSWSKGSAYLRASFVEKNDAAIAAAVAAIAKAQGEQ